MKRIADQRRTRIERRIHLDLRQQLPDPGVHAIFEYAALANRPGVRTLQHGDVSLASDATTYVFTKADFHSNLCRIPLRR
jgi:hypothetical protein